MLSLLQPAVLGMLGQTIRAAIYLRKVNKRKSYNELNNLRFFAPLVISGGFAISISLTFSDYPPLLILAGATISYIADKAGNLVGRDER